MAKLWSEALGHISCSFAASRWALAIVGGLVPNSIPAGYIYIYIYIYTYIYIYIYIYICAAYTFIEGEFR